METDDVIARAAVVVGEGASDDYVISPSGHAEMYEDRAPALAAVLRSSAVKTTARQYESEDEKAVAAQRNFMHVFNRVNRSVFATAVFIALVLAAAALAVALPESLTDALLVVFGVGSVVTGALAAKGLRMVRQGELLEEWMSKRALAETRRLEYFERVTRRPTDGKSTNEGIPLELLQLEYFRRYQLDVQLAYYGQRSQDHRAAASKTLSYSGWSVAGAAVVTGSAGLLGAFAEPAFAAIGSLGMVFTGLSSYASMREAVHQDRRNGERYERTHRVLEDLSKRLDTVRRAVRDDGRRPLEDFVEAVHEQLSLEHRQWLGELSEARGAFARLESTLKEISAERPAGS